MFGLEALTCLYLNAGKHDDAHRTLLRVLQSASVNRNGDWRQAAEIVGGYQRGLHQLRAGNAVEAAPKLKRSADDISQLLGDGHPFAAIVLFDYGRCLRAAGDQAAAITALERALEIGGTIVSAKHPLLLYGRTSLAAAYLDNGRLDDAGRLLATMKPNVIATWGDGSWQHADHCAMMAVVAFESERTAEATGLAVSALAIDETPRLMADDALGSFRADIWRRMARGLDEPQQAEAEARAVAIEKVLAQMERKSAVAD
jgi:tetratricopeptide (TPR) repeat protein